MEPFTKRLKTLGEEWLDFLQAILNPWTLLLIAIIIVLLVASQRQTNKVFVTLLEILVSIFASIVGALINKRWTNIAEASILLNRGKSAIRSLKLLLRHISSLGMRVREYSVRHGAKKADQEMTGTYFEEIILQCTSLYEETINSIQDWTDITPEADVKSQIEMTSELTQQINLQEQNLAKLNQELIQAREEKSMETERLKKQITEKEDELSKAKEQLWRKELDLGISPGPALNVLGIHKETHSYTSLAHTCSMCGKIYFSDAVELTPKCPGCRGSFTGIGTIHS